MRHCNQRFRIINQKKKTTLKSFKTITASLKIENNFNEKFSENNMVSSKMESLTDHHRHMHGMQC